MRIGDLTKLDNVTFDPAPTVVQEAGFDPENIIDPNSLKKWKVQNGAVTLTLQFDSITADAVCLFNCNIETSVELKTYSTYPGVVEDSITLTTSDLTGFTSLNALFELTKPTTAIEAIELIFLSADPSFFTSVGFIWVGELLDFECGKALQNFDDSEDEVTVTRANTVSVKTRYNFQEFNITTPVEEEFVDVQTRFRTILNGGYGTRRPYIFDEPPYDTKNELIYGIMESARVGYDIQFNSKNTERFTNATIKIREVF